MTQTQAERALTPIVEKIEDEVSFCLSSSPYVVYPFDNILSPDTRELHLIQGVVDLFTQAREKLGVPIQITSGYRTKAYQKELRKRKYKAAKISPHMYGTAFDLSIRNIKGVDHCARCWKLITALKEAAYNLGLLDYLRYGYRTYNCDFVHIDIVPLLFDGRWKVYLDKLPEEFYPYGFNNPNPENWKGGVTW